MPNATMPERGHYIYPRQCTCRALEHDHPTATCGTFTFAANVIRWVDGTDGRSPADDYVGAGGPNTGD